MELGTRASKRFAANVVVHRGLSSSGQRVSSIGPLFQHPGVLIWSLIQHMCTDRTASERDVGKNEICFGFGIHGCRIVLNADKRGGCAIKPAAKL